MVTIAVTAEREGARVIELGAVRMIAGRIDEVGSILGLHMNGSHNPCPFGIQ